MPRAPASSHRSPRPPTCGTGQDAGTRICSAAHVSRLRWTGETSCAPTSRRSNGNSWTHQRRGSRTRFAIWPNAPPVTSATTADCGGPSPAQRSCSSSRSSAVLSPRCAAARHSSRPRMRPSRRSWPRRCRSRTAIGRRRRCWPPRPTAGGPMIRGPGRRSGGSRRAPAACSMCITERTHPCRGWMSSPARRPRFERRFHRMTPLRPSSISSTSSPENHCTLWKPTSRKRPRAPNGALR